MDGVYRTALPAYRLLQRLKNAAVRQIDPPVVVLLYHRVTVLPTDPEQLAVSPDNFRAHLAYLKENFRLVRLEEDWTALSEPAVCITFDDGYADNALEALPILEAAGVPATFFVSTGNLGTDHGFWWDQMERILLHEERLPASFSLADRQFGREWPTATMAQRQALYATLNVLGQKVDAERLEGWLEQLRTWAGQKDTGAGLNRSLNSSELQRLAASPWATIGAHTVSHAALSALTDEQQRHEIFTSKETLEEQVGTR